MEAVRGRLVAWWVFAALAVACIVAAGDHPATAVAAPPAPGSIPPITGEPPMPLRPGAPARSGIGPASILALYANQTADDAGTSTVNCTNPANTDCSLRSALALANANPGSTVNVAANTYILTHGDANFPSSGLIVGAAMTIAGAGASSTIIEANAAPNSATYRVLHITGANVTVQGVTIRNGVVNVPASGIDGGAGVRVDAASAQITDSTISGNTVSGTDTTVAGGGIAVFGAGSATLLRTTVSGNVVAGTVTSGTRLAIGGGAAGFGPLTVRESLFVGNTAQGSGSSGTVTTSGGGIYNQSTTTISDSTIATNSADSSQSSGGGLPFGGGLSNLATMTVTSSTLSGNSAIASGSGTPQGGGVHNQSTVTFTNTIIANSTGGDFHTFGGTFTGDNNLFDDNSVLPTGTGNLNNTPALLGTLGNYGGPTQTAPLLPGSPAIDTGAAIDHGPSGNTVPATDQRGQSRVGTPDIGAFETKGSNIAKRGFGDNQVAPTTGTFTYSLAVGVAPVNAGEPVDGGQVTFAIAPVAGAGATFGAVAGCTVSGDRLTAVCTISGGIATSPPLTANDTAGAFTVSARATGAPTQTFNLRNIAVTLVVNTATDGDADISHCMTGNPNTCRLRDAIAGATPSKHTVTFADTAFPANTPTTIRLTANTFSLDTTVTVDGTGHMVVLDGGCTSCGIGGHPTNGVRVLVVQNTGVVTLIGLTITGGNNSGGPSAGILNLGTLTLTNSTVRGNYAPNGDGGGIGNDSGTLTLIGSTVTGNTAFQSGGGIYNYDDHDAPGLITLINSTVSGNATLFGGGGGIFNYAGEMTLVSGTVSGNTGFAGGGGIFNDCGGTLMVANSTVSGNSGANPSAAEGGGIDNFCGSTTLTNVTVSGNSGTSGGGLFSGGGGTITRSNTIVAGNSGGDEASDVGSTFSGSNNVIGGDPKLAPLGNNGGPTHTMLPLPGSPALDGYAPASGNCGSYTDPITGTTTNITADQRGLSRPQGAGCDIGAVEARFTLAITGGGTQSAPVNAAFAQPLAVTFGGPDAPSPPSGAPVTFAAHPVGGASATLGIPNPAATNASGAASVTATANGTGGAYTVTASTPGAASVTFNLANTPSLVTISPSSGGTGGGVRVTLTGFGFGTVAANVQVLVDGTAIPAGSIVSVADRQIVYTAPVHIPGTATVTVTVGGVAASGSETYTYGTANPLPGGQPPGGSGGNPNPLPGTRPGPAPSGNPNPLPGSRP